MKITRKSHYTGLPPLEQQMHNPPPRRHSSNSLPLCIDPFPFNNAPVLVDIYLVGSQPSSAFPEEATNPKEQDDGQGKVSLEESLG